MGARKDDEPMNETAEQRGANTPRDDIGRVGWIRLSPAIRIKVEITDTRTVYGRVEYRVRGFRDTGGDWWTQREILEEPDA